MGMPFYCFLVEGVFIGVHSALHLTELVKAAPFFHSPYDALGAF